MPAALHRRGARTPAIARSLGVEVRPQILFRDVLTCLPEDGTQGARVQLPVAGDGQRLSLASRAKTPQLDVASPLGVDDEAEGLQDADDVGAREAAQPRHGPVPSPS